MPVKSRVFQSKNKARTEPKIRVLSAPVLTTSPSHQTKQMASNFAQAIQCLVAERDRVFVERIAAEYNLPLEELKAKYLEATESAIKVPRQYKKREPKSVAVVAEKPAKAAAAKQCCQAQTSKKEPCKFGALKGEVFCKRHLRAATGDSDGAKPPAAPKKAKKAEQPMHSHPLATGIDAECELCSSHGNPLSVADAEFEVAHTGPVKTPTVAQRLAEILANTESDAESESDDEPTMDEEEYEDEE